MQKKTQARNFTGTTNSKLFFSHHNIFFNPPKMGATQSQLPAPPNNETSFGNCLVSAHQYAASMTPSMYDQFRQQQRWALFDSPKAAWRQTPLGKAFPNLELQGSIANNLSHPESDIDLYFVGRGSPTLEVSQLAVDSGFSSGHLDYWGKRGHGAYESHGRFHYYNKGDTIDLVVMTPNLYQAQLIRNQKRNDRLQRLGTNLKHSYIQQVHWWALWQKCARHHNNMAALEFGKNMSAATKELAFD
jgi:hypothetical protein